VPGHQTVVFKVGQIRLGDVICYEVGSTTWSAPRSRPGRTCCRCRATTPPSSGTAQTGESGQQLAMARIRAVEFDRAVVVASTTGYSAIIAPGRAGDHQQRHLAAGRARGARPAAHHTTLAERARRLAGMGDRRGDRGRARPRHRPASGGPAAPIQGTRRTDPAGTVWAIPRELPVKGSPGDHDRAGSPCSRRRRAATALRSRRVAAAGAPPASPAAPAVASQLNPTAVAARPRPPRSAVPQDLPRAGTKDASPADGITSPRPSGSKISAVTVKSTGSQRSPARSAATAPAGTALRAAHRAVVHGHRHRHRRAGHPVTADQQRSPR
jgi:hypothetical protein